MEKKDCTTKSVRDSDVKTKSNNKRGVKGATRNQRGSGFQKPYMKGPNDIAWRTSSSLSQLAGTLPFGYPAGLQYPNVCSRLNSPTTTLVDGIYAGIMSIRMLLTAGSSHDYNSALNLAIRKVYSYVRHANSGSKNYEAADLGLYFLSYAQGLGVLGYLQRLYRTICKFSSTNRYYPKELINSMGVDYDDIKQHQAELAWLIRWLGSSLKSLAVPKMSYFDACYYAFSHIFIDNTSPKEQIYIFNPEAFGIYDPTYSTTGGGVDYSNSATQIPDFGGTLLTYANIVTLVHTVMDVLLSDEDIGIMSGDILKAYGEDLFIPMAEPDADIEFEHSEEVLQQVHNLSCFPSTFITFSGYKQNPGATNTAPYIELDASTTTPVSGSTYTRLEFIDAFSAVPDFKEVFNCCVLKAICRHKPTSGATTYDFDMDTFEFGAYLVRSVGIIAGVGSAATKYNYGPYLNCCNVGMQATVVGSGGVVMSSNFDWHPIACCLNTNQNFFMFSWGDVQNINFFSDVIFKRIFDSSMLSLFDFESRK